MYLCDHGAEVIVAEFEGHLNPLRAHNPLGVLTLQRGKKSVLLTKGDPMLQKLRKLLFCCCPGYSWLTVLFSPYSRCCLGVMAHRPL